MPNSTNTADEIRAQGLLKGEKNIHFKKLEKKRERYLTGHFCAKVYPGVWFKKKKKLSEQVIACIMQGF